MKRFLCVAAIALSCLCAAPANAAESYDAIVARVRAGDVRVDYTAFRNAYAQSSHYQPETGDFDQDRSAMLAAFNAQDCGKALASADKVLNAIFIDIVTHLVSGRCFEMTGDAAKAEFHRTIARGLIDSILASGDGKAPATAYVVVTISEEYDVLTTLRLKLKVQSLVQDNGHSYDAMQTTSPAGAATTVYFQIDRPMAWLSHALEH